VALGDREVVAAAERNIRWALSCQDERGWFSRFSFPDGERNNLHGIAYTLEGIVEVGLPSGTRISSRRRGVGGPPDAAPRDGLALADVRRSLRRGLRPVGRELVPTASRSSRSSASSSRRACGDKAYRTYASRPHRPARAAAPARLRRAGAQRPAAGKLAGRRRYERYFLPNWAIKFYLDCLLIQEGVDPFEVHG
jgi:hypothetical protein